MKHLKKIHKAPIRVSMIQGKRVRISFKRSMLCLKIALAQEKEETKEEKIKAAVAKAKQKVAQKILAKIISANDTIALDNTKLALMIALSDQQGFSAYQELTLQDMEFYLDNGLLDAYLPTNNISQYFLFGGSDVLMNDLVNMQYE